MLLLTLGPQRVVMSFTNTQAPEGGIQPWSRVWPEAEALRRAGECSLPAHHSAPAQHPGIRVQLRKGLMSDKPS